MSSEQDDLYGLIEALQRKHQSTCGHCCYDYPADCQCGWQGSEDEGWSEHVSRLVGDLLIDLAGTGQLLAAIDRIARPKSPGECQETAGGKETA